MYLYQLKDLSFVLIEVFGDSNIKVDKTLR